MGSPRFPKRLMIFVGVLVLVYAAVVALVGYNQRSFLYFPSHAVVPGPLSPWVKNGQILGYCRPVEKPRMIWLMLHGNGGQAAHRAYVLSHLGAQDALYVLEYPGYGLRPGAPSRPSFDQAALQAYENLRNEFPQTPMGVLGESIGSGPASTLASAAKPPDKIVLVVPFDSLTSVASDHLPWLPIRLLLQDRWDNVDALKSFTGPLEIYGATQDRIIGLAHAKNLAAQLPRARFIEIPGGHNDWSSSELVRLEK